MDSFDSTTKKFKIPLLTDSVSAGFPSPADDYTEENIDLNEHLISNPFSTFFLRVKGDSMINAGIKDKDLIIVDKSLTARPGNIIICLSEEGKQFNSIELCSLLLSFKNKKINFLIGDTDGISSDIKDKSDLILSLSPLTFPHELARLILIEQIYRAISISNNSPYHRS